MSIWHYSGKVRDRKLVISGLKLKLCPFCNWKLERIVIPGKHMSYGNYVVCFLCGWWGISWAEYGTYSKDRGSRGKDYEVRGGQFGAIATLRDLDVSDVSMPIQDVRNYLIVKYEVRHQVHPRLFEETVASVFKDFGYLTKVTAYSGDGGIDVILQGQKGQDIGIQVKRYQGTIQVEQIRSFAGALLIEGYTKGIFITTSRFASGASKTAARATLRGIEVELIDAPRFYDALGLAQLNRANLVEGILHCIKQHDLMLLKKYVF